MVCTIIFKYSSIFSTSLEDSPIWNSESSKGFRLSESSCPIYFSRVPSSRTSILRFNWTISTLNALISALKSWIDKGFFFHST